MVLSEKSIFICGEARSGTKLLRDILGKHPSIYILKSETYIFVDSPFQKITLRNNATKEILIKSVLTMMLSKNRIQAQKMIREEEFSEEVNEIFLKLNNAGLISLIPETKIEIFDFLANFLAKEIQHKKRWLEKTPFHIYYIEKILDFFPDAKIIINYRDPRAVIASWLKKDKYKSILGLVYTWNKLAEWILELKANPQISNSLFFVRYEDLVAQPEITLENICKFIQEDFNKQLLDITVVNSLFEEKGQKGFNLTAINRWKNFLSKGQCVLIDILTSSNRKKFAYENAFKANAFDLIYALLLLLPFEILVFVYKKLVKFSKWI